MEIAVRKERIHTTKGGKVACGVAFAVFAVYSLTHIFALGWAFVQSFKGSLEFFNSMRGLPEKWLFSNYAEAVRSLSYNDTSFMGMFVNSLWFAVGSSVLSVFMHCATGYGFAKYRFKGKEAAFAFIIFTITLPVVGTLPSLYKVVQTLKLNDTPLFLVTALGGFGGNFLVTYAYFKSIDGAYAEAAQIDGAGHAYIFFCIMLPLAVGPIVALSTLGVILQWNNFETPLLFLDKMPTLSSGLYRFSVVMRYKSNMSVFFAGVLMTALPVVVLVAVFGKMIMKNMTVGGIKG